MIIKNSLKDSTDFPEDFIFGTATSAFQIEGEGDTEWKGFIGKDGTRLGRAIDHYDMYRQDLKHILYLGNAYRFSMDWSKLQKSAFGPLDRTASSHYMEIFRELKKNNKKTMLVINHFSNPLWLARMGGWTNKKSAGIYLDYLKKILEIYSGCIDYINTFNEPNAYALMAYVMRDFPPKRFNPLLRRRVLFNMREAHRMAYDYIKEHYPYIKVGISHAQMFTQPLKKKAIIHRFLKWFMDFYLFEHINDFFVGDGRADFIGFSYYGRILTSTFPIAPSTKKGREVLDKLCLEYDDMMEKYPAGIYYLIKRFYAKYDKPIIITENGTCTDNDSLRIKNLYDHLYYVKKALDEGINVEGYFHWSTFDNYELAHGPTRRFGLVSVDFNSPTLERKIKKSGNYYHEISKTRKLLKY